MRQIFAHRGASGYAPENTLEAFELAVRQGAHGVELDVHLSRDGEVVVTHDEAIGRVSDGQGNVREMTLLELKGFRFNKTHPKYKRATIPTLCEVYELLKPTGLSVNVELKNSGGSYPGLERKCVEIAAKMGMSDRVLYSSFNHESMMRMKWMDAEVRCGLLYGGVMVRPWAYAVALGVDALHPCMSEMFRPSVCEAAHRVGLEVNVWTVDSEAQIEKALRMGVDRVITNFPDRALTVLSDLAL